MRIAKYRDAIVFRLNVRGGAGPVDPGLAEDDKPGVQYRRLFRGDPDRPGNFEMVVLRSPRDDASIHFPRHRHDFDQVRLTLAGNPAWAPKRKVPPGSVVYTAAGTFYGPYDRFADEEQLHIQFEGANHARFLDYDTFADARRRMSRDGRFERGVYVTAAADGRETKVDAHQAVMEFLTGAPMAYPKSRYTDSVQIDPALFAWDAAGPGARTKQLGTFTECLTALWMAQIDAGARYSFPANPQTRLVFVQDGTGVAEGEEIGPRDGLLLAPGETGAVAAATTLTLFVLTLPKTGDQTTTEEAEAA